MNIKKIVIFSNRLITNPINYLILKFNGVKYETFPSINGILKIVQRGSIGLIEFGRKVTINCSQSYNMIGGPYGSSIMIRNGGKLKIGSNVGMSSVAIVCANVVTIGSNINIGGGTKIWDTDFHSLSYSERIGEDKMIVTKPIVIKDGCFIGGNCTILKGVTIGEKSVVGACSVVTKSIPDGEIWAGNPARFIKKIGRDKL